MTIQEYFGDWSEVVDLKEADRLINNLSKFSTGSICPQLKDIFKAFHLCPLHTLRLVILAQDPYTTLKKAVVTEASASGLKSLLPVATGIAFANDSNTPVKNLSPSLEVLRESVIDYEVPHGIVTFDPSLEKWEAQGVLMLNSALSCEAGRVGSHMLMWRPFITSFLTNLVKRSWGIVYVLMGSQAQSFEPYINKEYNHILKCKHPSYYARTHQRMPSHIWKQINQILISQNGYGIDWYEENK